MIGSVQEFNAIAADLAGCAHCVRKWNKVQDNHLDDLIPDFWHIRTFSELEDSISNLDNPAKEYARYRWFIKRCADCDEYLFSINDDVKRNPDEQDKKWDLEFIEDKRLRFDLKSTSSPDGFVKLNPEVTIFELLRSSQRHPKSLADWLYEHQSKGRRMDFQSRLFIVYHSFKTPKNDLTIRLNLDFKKKLYSDYVASLRRRPFFTKSHNVLCDFIWIVEKSDGEYFGFISSLNRNS